MKTKQTHTLWGAAFGKAPSDTVLSFTAGRDVAGVSPADIELLPYDVWCNQAHVVMLVHTGIIPKIDGASILMALGQLEVLVDSHVFMLSPLQEDVHTNIESWLTQKLGIEVAGKLHTARSRNDQVLTDMKMYLRDNVIVYIEYMLGLTFTLLELADTYKSVPISGYTHHQHAMVTTFGHMLAGFASMIVRDIERLKHWYVLHNLSPLGNVVSYGTSMPIDRKMTSTLLGFDGADHNSLDSVTNRWEPEADLAFGIVTLMNHLSIVAETLIMFSTTEFGMITLADSYSTGSSMMPQKKNPDTLEVIKAKAAYAQGQLNSLLSLGKGLFVGYNRDSQWSKYIIMDLVRECMHAAVVLGGVVSSMTVHKDRMEAWCNKGFIGAPTLMEQMISTYHLPMRVAKVIVEKAVMYSAGLDHVTYKAVLQALADEGIQVPITEIEVLRFQNPHMIISLTKSYGSAGKHSMKQSLKSMHKKLVSHKAWLIAKKKKKDVAKKLLKEMVEGIVDPPSPRLQVAKGGE